MLQVGIDAVREPLYAIGTSARYVWIRGWLVLDEGLTGESVV
jgi:hypothetical protein